MSDCFAMMHENISPLVQLVKQSAVLTGGSLSNSVCGMRFGERLKKARGGMTQAQLSKESGQSQAEQRLNELWAAVEIEAGMWQPPTKDHENPPWRVFFRGLAPSDNYRTSKNINPLIDKCN